MKKKLMLCLLLLTTAWTAHAQYDPASEFDNQGKGKQKKEVTTSSENETGNESKDDDAIVTVNFLFQSFDHHMGEFYGLSDHYINPNGIGCDFTLRSNFKYGIDDIGIYAIDLGLNYTAQLWGQDKNKVLFTLAAGPTLNWHDTFTNKGEKKTKCDCDLFFNPRFGAKIGIVTLSAGYFFWAVKAKFEKGYKFNGFQASIGIDV